MKNLVSNLTKIAPQHHRYKVFEDFITICAITLQNSVLPKTSPQFVKLEEEYLKIIDSYAKNDRELLVESFAELVMLLDKTPTDVLGSIFMSMELGNEHQGQFFTPDCVSQMMAEIQMVNFGEIIALKPFITLLEPACGAGGMILAAVKKIIKEGYNPAKHLWVQAIDISRIAALMCYIQLSLWNVPAQIIVGNTLSMEYREFWYTPAHIIYNWEDKLKQQQNKQAAIEEALIKETETVTIPTITSPVHSELTLLEKPMITLGEQMGFDF